QVPVKRRGPAGWALAAAGCAAAIAVLFVPLWIHFQRGDERPIAQAPPPAAGPASRGNIQALPGSMPGSFEPGPAGPAPGSGPAPSSPVPGDPARARGPSGPAIAGGKPLPAGEPAGPIPVPGKPGSQDKSNEPPPDEDRGDELAFDSVTVSFKAPLSR